MKHIEPRVTFRHGFGLTSKDALNCRRCAAVKIVLGRFGPLRPSLCLPVLSTTKSSAMPLISCEGEKSIKWKYCKNNLLIE